MSFWIAPPNSDQSRRAIAFRLYPDRSLRVLADGEPDVEDRVFLISRPGARVNQAPRQLERESDVDVLVRARTDAVAICRESMAVS